MPVQDLNQLLYHILSHDPKSNTIDPAWADEKNFQTRCSDQKKGGGQLVDHPSVAGIALGKIEKRCRKSNYAHSGYRGPCGLFGRVVTE